VLSAAIRTLKLLSAAFGNMVGVEVQETGLWTFKDVDVRYCDGVHTI
jgi:hypothetical protein